MTTKNVIEAQAKELGEDKFRRHGVELRTSYLSDYYVGVLNSQFIVRMVTLPYPNPAVFEIQDLRYNRVTEKDVERDQESAEALLMKLKSLI